MDEVGRQRCLASWGFVVFAILLLVGFREPLASLARMSFQLEQYSHLLVIPLVSISLVYRERKKIFQTVAYRWDGGAVLLITGAAILYVAHRRWPFLSENDFLSLTVQGLVTLLLGAFVCLFGRDAFRTALFPLLFLFLTAPLPDFVLRGTIRLLQIGSAYAVDWAFTLAGIPVFRQGFVFHLPGLTIAVAEQCSGIRSSMALLITSLLAGHLFLRSWGKKVVLCLSVFPITVIKNGLRIYSLSALGLYVDSGFLVGWLHQQGGVVVFAMGVMLLGAILWVLQRYGRKSEDRGSTALVPGYLRGPR